MLSKTMTSHLAGVGAPRWCCQPDCILCVFSVNVDVFVVVIVEALFTSRAQLISVFAQMIPSIPCDVNRSKCKNFRHVYHSCISVLARGLVQWMFRVHLTPVNSTSVNSNAQESPSEKLHIAIEGNLV